MCSRVGVYYYFFPTFRQGKRVLWDGIGGDGFRFMDHFPEGIVADRNSTEMKIRLRNGSIFQIIGTDNLDMSIIGANPVGCVFSEYALQSPKAWDLMRPVLRENGGWAAFLYTPRGRNHGFSLYEQGLDNPNDWFVQLLTSADTARDDGSPIITRSDIEEEIRSGMPPELAEQEFNCSFNAGMEGNYYGDLLTEAEEDGRITHVTHNPRNRVITCWDLGVDDATAIWFFQVVNHERFFIDYEESRGKSFEYYAKILLEKPYIYETHVFPADIRNRDVSIPGTRKDIAFSLGIRPIREAPKWHIADGINSVRMMIKTSYFDEKKCKIGLEALRNYRKEWDEGRREFKPAPLHDWTSHAADALRAGAVGYQGNVDFTPVSPQRTIDPMVV